MSRSMTRAPIAIQFEAEAAINKSQNNDSKMENEEFRKIIVWRNVAIFTFLHLGALYGIYSMFMLAKIQTTIYGITMAIFSGFGITAGAHRLWAHRSYKATRPLQVLLIICNTMACQNTVIEWARDHRVHHKYTETDADPHDARRGFFFAHIGWLLSRKHPAVAAKGKGVDISDLEQDPLLIFQRDNYVALLLIIWLIIPTLLPVYLWNETWTNAFFVGTIFRYVLLLNGTWCVNSAAHLFGSHPYDKSINPAENKFVSLLAIGEGWHNYHHVFPWDYKAAELGIYNANLTTAFIDFFAWIGWAYDLKTVSEDVIKNRVKRTGDDTHEVWGWGDKDQSQKERDSAILIKPHGKN